MWGKTIIFTQELFWVTSHLGTSSWKQALKVQQCLNWAVLITQQQRRPSLSEITNSGGSRIILFPFSTYPSITVFCLPSVSGTCVYIGMHAAWSANKRFLFCKNSVYQVLISLSCVTIHGWNEETRSWGDRYLIRKVQVTALTPSTMWKSSRKEPSSSQEADLPKYWLVDGLLLDFRTSLLSISHTICSALLYQSRLK